MRRLAVRRRGRVLLAACAAGTALASLLSYPPAQSARAAGSPAAAASAAFSKTETIERDHLVNGADQVADTRTVTVGVDQTTNLQERQEIRVDWSGAHPTGGVVADPNSSLAAQEEYPVVLMECRGLDSATAPAGEQLSPSTCWTATPSERTQSDYNNPFPSFRLDRYDAVADRDSDVGVPSPLPSDCLSFGSGVQHWVPFIASDGTEYPTGPQGCAGLPPEASNYQQDLQPSNTTYAVSDANGDGSANFVISTAESNASLGCSDTVPCSLVVIPIMGISCDAAGEAPGLPPSDIPAPAQQAQAYALCSATGNFKAGQPSNGFSNQEALAVSGLLWWSASNWRNRISVPLTFAPAPDSCDLSNPSPPLYLYGSEFMAQAALQWEPAFCLNPSLFKFHQVLSAEPEAKGLLSSGSVEAAIQAAPPDTAFPTSTVQAPIGVTGFAVTYDIDGADGQPYTSLKLTPRLLAKLLTESYPAVPAVRDAYPELQRNPLNITVDPEFQALNPGVPTSIFYSASASTIFVVSSGSDAVSALTAYINADPTARAWLNGTPDPWGMVVNPNYKGIQLPVDSWPLLDTFEGGAAYLSDNNPCLAASPTPFLPLVAAPTSQFQTVSLYMQFGVAPSQINCSGSTSQDQKLVAVGREQPGVRFLLGITPLADAVKYRLNTAALQTQVSPAAATKFTDSTGRTFVAPDDGSLAAAAALLQPDPGAGTWTIPYGDFQTDAAAAGAYPGTLLMSADIPTTGLPPADAQRYSELLTYAAGPGQTPGVDQGQLVPGFVPMTAANNLGAEDAYTVAAAAAVAAQQGLVPPLMPSTTPAKSAGPTGGGSSRTGGGSTTGRSTTAAVTPAGDSSQQGSDSGTSAPNGSSPAGGARPSKASTRKDSPAQAQASVVEPVGHTVFIGSGLGGLAIPLAGALALISAVAGGVAYGIRRRTSP